MNACTILLTCNNIFTDSKITHNTKYNIRLNCVNYIG